MERLKRYVQFGGRTLFDIAVSIDSIYNLISSHCDRCLVVSQLVPSTGFGILRSSDLRSEFDGLVSQDRSDPLRPTSYSQI